jgi:hypothetical protein
MAKKTEDSEEIQPEGETTESKATGFSLGTLTDLSNLEAAALTVHERKAPAQLEAAAVAALAAALKGDKGGDNAKKFAGASVDKILASAQVQRAGLELVGVVFNFGRKFYFAPKTNRVFL